MRYRVQVSGRPDDGGGVFMEVSTGDELEVVSQVIEMLRKCGQASGPSRIEIAPMTELDWKELGSGLSSADLPDGCRLQLAPKARGGWMLDLMSSGSPRRVVVHHCFAADSVRMAQMKAEAIHGGRLSMSSRGFAWPLVNGELVPKDVFTS